jgi:hypothetical protein
MLVDWKDLSPEARELLAKLLEGRDHKLTDESLATLEELGLIELNAGSWWVPQSAAVYMSFETSGVLSRRER